MLGLLNSDMGKLKESFQPCMYDSMWVCENCFWQDINSRDIEGWITPKKRDPNDIQSKRYWAIRSAFNNNAIELTKENLSELLFNSAGYFDRDIKGKRFWIEYDAAIKFVAKALTQLRKEWIEKNDNKPEFIRCPFYRDKLEGKI